MENKILYCPVCGCPTSEYDEFIVFGGTCPCCAFEFGIDESNYGANAFMKYREKWIKDGLQFMSTPESSGWHLQKAIDYLNNLKSVDLTNYFLCGKIDISEWNPNFDKNDVVRYWKD